MNPLKPFALFILLICFGKVNYAQSDAVKINIEQPTVKGTIVLPSIDYKTTDYYYMRTFEDTIGIEGVSIEIGSELDLKILPTTISLEEEWAYIKNAGIPITIEKQTSDYIIYQFNNDMIKTYKFILLKKGKSKAFVLDGGPQMFKSLTSLATAEKLLKTAQSYEPVE